MADLLLTCKSCGKSFSSGMTLDRDSIKSTALSQNTHECPHCGQSNTYDQLDYKTSDV